MTQVIKGGPQVRTYMGYSADGLTVRTIQTRDPAVTFADNAAVLAATHLTGSNPTHAINDAIRDKRGNVVQLTGPNGVQTLSLFDPWAVGREVRVVRFENDWLGCAKRCDDRLEANLFVVSVPGPSGSSWRWR